MNCPACSHENPESARFCNGCGAKLEAKCASCGAQNPPGARFCSGCGQALTGAPSPSRKTASDPRAYTPKHLADKILASKSALEGERKQVTVLFADVKGSMDLAEQVDPEEWHKILNRFFEILTDGVHRFEGTVNQYTGDGIMALFGAPITHEDHAHRACYAALHLRDELRLYARTLRMEKGLDFSVRIGLNSGEVIVGKIGDDLRMDYTAQGHTVGLAARMEQLAEAGKINLTDRTAALVEGFFEMEDLGLIETKGVREPVRVFELSGVGAMRTRLDVSRARGLSRFVGRAAETGVLDQALARALEGQAQVIGVVAEAGVGKSRLCAEFVERCQAQGIRVRQTHGVAHGKTIPFLPVLDLMRGFFGVAERDTDDEARRKIAGTVVLLDRDLGEMVPVLFDFLGVADPAHPAPRLAPEARQRQLFALVRRLVRARSHEAPAVVLIEDLHWLDGGSELFLENMVESLPGTRSLLLLNFRPEYRAPWMDRSYYQRLPLQPLGPAEMKDLLGHLLGGHASLGGLPDRIAERTAGNPFFVEEVVRSLAEAGVLEGAAGAYRLGRPVNEAVIPASVQALLGARIDRLAEGEKQVLQTAAVIGKEFAATILKEVAELPDEELDASLRALISREFIYERALYPEVEYAFKHPLTQEVAYRSQLSARRARIHAAVARAIEGQSARLLDERAALIAHHWDQAGDAMQAARWHARAGEWAGLRDLVEALRHWRSVIARLTEVPSSPEAMGLGLMARMRILNLGWRLGMAVEEAERLFEEGCALALETGNTHARAILHFLVSAVKALSGEVEEGMRLGETAIRLAEEAGDRGLVLGGRINVCFQNVLLGQAREALARLDEMLARFAGDPKLGADITGFSPWIQGHLYRSIALLMLGRAEDGRRALDQTMALAMEHGEMEICGWTYGNYLYLHEMTGDAAASLEHARRAFEVAERIGSSFSRVAARWALGNAHLQGKRHEEAREALESGLALARETRAGLLSEGRLTVFLAEACLGCGDRKEARRLAEEALALLAPRRTRMYEIPAYITMARVLLEEGDAASFEEAGRNLARAEALIRETGMVFYSVELHRTRARLAGLRGDEAGRRAALAEERRCREEMGGVSRTL